MQITSTLDMTVPIWGVIGTAVACLIYAIKIKFEVDQIKKELKEIKELFFEFIKPKSE